jgi:polysaccharide biosynthesis transport protein
MRRRLETLIGQRQNEIRELNKRLSDAGMAASNRMSPREAELFELTRTLIELKTDHEQAKQYYETTVGQIQSGIDPPTIENFVNQDNQVYSLRSLVSNIEIELKSMPTQGNANRQRELLESRLAAARQQLEDRVAEVRIQARNQLVSSAQQQFQFTQSQLESVNERITSLRAELGDLNFTIFEVMSKQDDLAADKERLKQVQVSLDLLAISITREQTGVSWGILPDEPETPSFPKFGMVMSVSLLIGLALSLAIAFIREAMDTTIRSPRDIQRVGQLTLLGMISDEDDDPQVSGVPLPLVIFQAPTSILAEQYRQVRTRLQHAASLDTTRSILITSPEPGDGKTTVAVNLAAGLALNGRRILLVDVNFRRPMLHKVFNAENETGLSTVLGDLGNFENVVKQTQVPNLDILTCGPRPDNTTELLESRRFTDFIDRALEQYDHVLLDSGPLLLVSDTVALAPRVHGVITVVKAATNTRGVLQRLKDNLRQIKAEHLGVVLNGVRSQGGGYYGRNIRSYYEYQNGHAK